MPEHNVGNFKIKVEGSTATVKDRRSFNPFRNLSFSMGENEIGLASVACLLLAIIGGFATMNSPDVFSGQVIWLLWLPATVSLVLGLFAVVRK